ncbi:MAG: dTDP-4-dehydrorhamnose reductase [Bacteroidales bacterium]|jgi:dTDP-4-dehydrorhamnose reductase|nr:dTDP-4-dehydrorhamnose reductase [Bacteroidales bacterium]
MLFLITGANGQLGSTLKEILPKDQAMFAERSDLDVVDKVAVQNLVSQYRFDFIINCAAYTAVDRAEDEPEKAYSANVTGAQNLAETGIPIVHISTDYVFDGMHFRPYTETDATSPLSVYGKTKRESEEAVFKNSDTAIIIRTSWLWSKYGNNFVKTILKLASERESLRIVSDQIGTPTFTEDLALAIVRIIPQISKGTKEIYHFSNEGVCSWYDFAISIVKTKKLVCKIIPINSEDYPQKAKRPFYSVLNKSKIKRDFGIEIPHWEHLKLSLL